MAFKVCQLALNTNKHVKKPNIPLMTCILCQYLAQMSGANYTAKDIAKAYEYAETNVNKLLMNAMYESHPHLISHLKLENGILKGNRQFIQQFSCFNLTTTTQNLAYTCTPENKPVWNRIGDHTFQIGCYWPCFNLTDVVIDEKTKKPLVQNNRWQLTPSGEIVLFPTTHYWFEVPLLRDDARYAERINNVPTGFDYNESTRLYKLNDTYCNMFSAKYRDNVCKSRISPVLNWVFGETFMKYAYGLFEGTLILKPLSEEALPLPPDKDIPTIVQWKSTIDPNYKMQKPETLPIETLIVNDSQSYTDSKTKIVEILEQLKERLIAFVKQHIQELGKFEHWKNLAVQHVVQKLIEHAIKMGVEKILAWVVVISAKQKILFTALNRSLIYFTLKFIQLEATKLFLKGSLMVFQTVMNVFSIVTLITSILDILLMIFDPLNLNSEMSNMMLNQIQQQLTKQFYEQENTRIVLDPMSLSSILNLKDRETILFQNVLYVYKYLNELQYNSDGFPIIRDIIILDTSDNTGGLKPVEIVSTFSDIETFQDRAKCFKIFKYAVISLSGILILTLIAKLYILALIIMVLIVFFIGLTYLNLSFNVPTQITGTLATINELFGQVLEENRTNA